MLRPNWDLRGRCLVAIGVLNLFKVGSFVDVQLNPSLNKYVRDIDIDP